MFTVTADPVALVVLFTPSAEVWTSDAVLSPQSDQHDIVVWHPGVEPIRVNLVLAGDATPESVQLIVTRVLTPPPSQVILDGRLEANPNIPPDYPSTPLTAERGDGTFTFRDMEIQPGETTLTLRWRGSHDPAHEYELRVALLDR